MKFDIIGVCKLYSKFENSKLHKGGGVCNRFQVPDNICSTSLDNSNKLVPNSSVKTNSNKCEYTSIYSGDSSIHR